MSLLLLDKQSQHIEVSLPDASCHLFADTSVAEGEFQNSSVAEIGNNQIQRLVDIANIDLPLYKRFPDVMREGERKRSLLFLKRDSSNSQQPQAIMEAREDILFNENMPISAKDFQISVSVTKRNGATQREEEQKFEIRKTTSHCQQAEDGSNMLNGGKQSQDKSQPIIDIQSPECQSLNVKNTVIQTRRNNSEQTPREKHEHFISQRKNSMFYKNSTLNKERGGPFSLIFFVNRFLFHLRKTLLFFRPHQLNSLQLELIGDIAAQEFYSEGFGVPYTITSFETPYCEEKQADSQLLYSASAVSGVRSSVYYNQNTFQKQKQQRVRERKMRLFFRKLSRMYLFKMFLKSSSHIYQIFRRISRTIFNKIPLIDSNKAFFHTWQLLIYLCDLICVIYIPFKYCFEEINFIDKYFFQVLFPIIYGLNVIFNFNVAVYNRGTLITSRKKIIALYLRSFFLIDMLSATAQLSTMLVHLARILYSNPTISQIRQNMLMNSKLNAVEQFMSLSFKIILFAHIFGCIWHKLGVHYLHNNQGWMYEFHYQNDSIQGLYIICFYFAVVTMSTIGYGDIYAVTTGERIFMIFCVFIACGLYGYTLNSIGTILSNLKSQSENYTKKQAQLEEYLQLHQVDIGLRNRARKYIEYVYEQENMLKRDGQENLKLLNSFLKDEIQKDINKRVLQKARTIFQGISKNSKFFERLAEIVKEQIFGPEEFVHISGSSQPPALYIISYGEVELFIQRRDHMNALKVIKVLSAGCIFGQHGFFTNNQKNCLSARSVGVTYISSIALEDFQLLLQEFVEEKERFYNIRDMVLINNKNCMINLNCISCASDSHSIDSCPYLSYSPCSPFDYQKTMKIVKNVQKDEERKFKKKTRTTHRHASLVDLLNTQAHMREFQNDKKELIMNLVTQIYLFMEEEQENYEGSYLGIDGEREDPELENPQSYLQNHFPDIPKHHNMNIEKNKEFIPRSIQKKNSSGFKRSLKGQKSLGTDQNQKSQSESESQQKSSLPQLPQESSETTEEDSSEEKEQIIEQQFRGKKKSKTQLSKDNKNVSPFNERLHFHDEQQFQKTMIGNSRKSLPIMHSKPDLNNNLSEINGQLIYQLGAARRQSNEIAERKQGIIMASIANLNGGGYGFSQSPLFHQNSHRNKNPGLVAPLSPQIQNSQSPKFKPNIFKQYFSNQNPVIFAPNSSSNSNYANSVVQYNNNSNNTLFQSQRSNGGINTNSFFRNNTLYNNNNNSSNNQYNLLNVPEDLYTQDKSQKPSFTKQGDKSWTNQAQIAREFPFDLIKSYLVYFPHNNFEAICNKWNEKLKTKSFKRDSKRGKKLPLQQRQVPHGVISQFKG